ncbi:MAG: hypothetical protein KC503_35035 [Myxococcales bacterium]|nr:hypothetical protein [Myxococcales bacterium]
MSAPSAQDRSTVPPTGQPVSPEPASKDKGENDVTPTISAARTAEGHLGIKRSELDKLLKRGANNFIGLIDVRPAFRRGRFFGWRVLGYRGPGALQRGDVVLRINGQSVERPGQFIGVWQRLATAKVLVVEILRRGKRKRWAFAILDS